MTDAERKWSALTRPQKAALVSAARNRPWSCRVVRGSRTDEPGAVHVVAAQSLRDMGLLRIVGDKASLTGWGVSLLAAVGVLV